MLNEELEGPRGCGVLVPFVDVLLRNPAGLGAMTALSHPRLSGRIEVRMSRAASLRREARDPKIVRL